jgi:aerobic C4-dicarboxylate transport protein
MTTEAVTVRKARKPLYRNLTIQILVAMLLGVLVGWLWPWAADGLKVLGDLFIRLVTMVVGPIIFCTVVHGIASVGEARSVGRIALKAFVYFEIVTTIALVLALIWVNVLQPGVGMNIDPSTFTEQEIQGVPTNVDGIHFGQFLLDIVPSSAIGAFAEGEVLSVLFFSVMFAFGLLAIGPKGKPIVDGIESVSHVLFKIIAFVMYTAPIGAFGAIGFTVGRFGPEALLSLGVLVLEFYLLCLVFVLVVLWPIARLYGINFFKLIRYAGAEVILVMGTSSSESVFPRLHAKLRALGARESVVALVLPSAYAFNDDGTCLYFAMVSVFLAQAVGIDLSLGEQLFLLLVMLVTSKGGAGVAGSAIVVLATTLSATDQIPVAAVGLILGVHRLLSSAFVPVNVMGYALCTLVIAKSEGALDETALHRELERGPTA